MQMLDDRPSQRQAIVGARASTDLVENDQRSLGSGIENAGGLNHFDHEGTLTAGQFITCTDSSEQAICYANGGFAGWDEAAYLCKHQEQGRLSNVRALSGHVWSGDQQYAPVLRTDHGVVGYECPLGQGRVQNRVPPFVYF